MRTVPTLIAGALLVPGTVACGGSGQETGSPSRISATVGGVGTGTEPAGGYHKGDDDQDEGIGVKDADDGALRAYGHAAGTGDERSVTALVKRWYATAAAGDGATACGLMLRRLAEEPNLGDAAEEAYPPAPGAPTLHGRSCARIMSLLFREDHRQLAADSATLVVTAIRVDGAHAVALLGFRTTPERKLPLVREGHVWKVDSLLDLEII